MYLTSVNWGSSDTVMVQEINEKNRRVTLHPTARTTHKSLLYCFYDSGTVAFSQAAWLLPSPPFPVCG